MSVSNAIGSALYSKLTQGTPLACGTAVFRGQGTAGAPLPYAVFSLQAGGPLNQTPGDLRDEVYFVRAYGTSMAQAGTIDGQISGLLHHGTLSVAGYTNYYTARETDLELVENPPDGKPVYMAGALYRISLDA